MQVTGSSNTQATNSPRVRTKHARANVALCLSWAPTHLHNHNVLKTWLHEECLCRRPLQSCLLKSFSHTRFVNFVETLRTWRFKKKNKREMNRSNHLSVKAKLVYKLSVVLTGAIGICFFGIVLGSYRSTRAPKSEQTAGKQSIYPCTPRR
jgi:hypothetical protein